MGRSFEPFQRRSGIQTPDKIIIACEGVESEPFYFNALATKNSHIEVEILSREGKEQAHSAPRHVLHQLQRFKRQHDLRKHDQLWMVVDVDQWHNLSEIGQQCMEEGFHLALSNPCFELWLLLHLRSLDEYSAEEQAQFLENRKVSSKRTRLDKELSNLLLEGYDKRRPQHFIPLVKIAIERAKRLDGNPNELIPTTLGSRVYRLAEKIIQGRANNHVINHPPS